MVCTWFPWVHHTQSLQVYQCIMSCIDSILAQKHAKWLVESKWFWHWCITLRISGFMDFFLSILELLFCLGSPIELIETPRMLAGKCSFTKNPQYFCGLPSGDYSCSVRAHSFLWRLIFYTWWYLLSEMYWMINIGPFSCCGSFNSCT